MWERRQFLKAAGAGFLGSLLPRQAAALANSDLVFATACQTADGNFAAALVSEQGEVIRTATLPGRGHDVTQCPATGRLVVFARRPGNFAVVFSAGGEALATIHTPADRHFYGHGEFSPDGKLLYATENDFEAARGVIGIYDATDGFTRIGEFDSGGVGPHEMLLSADARLICVANGGIETHPDYGREKLNIPTMQPNISWIDRDNGTLAATHDIPAQWHMLSLRHMAHGADGSMWIGGQYQGAVTEIVPLIARVAPDAPLVFVDLPEPQLGRLANYIGSVAGSADGSQLVFTSPLGDAAIRLDTATGRSDLIEMANVCGAAFDGQQPVLSSGNGQLDSGQGTSQTDVFFDHHMAALKRF